MARLGHRLTHGYAYTSGSIEEAEILLHEYLA